MDYVDLSDHDFKRFSDLVYQKCGINLHDGKKTLVRARLGKRLRQGGFKDFNAYYRFVSKADNEQELVQLLDAISTNLTSFFREEKHFDFLKERLFPSFLEKSQRKIRIWSAGCSSGEEPYSLAMCTFEYFGLNNGLDMSILASDISTRVLSQAQKGVYRQERVINIKEPILRKYFQKGVGRQTGNVRVKAFVRDRVRFERINLMEPFPFKEKFDIIFCRNVMIYFDADIRRRLLAELHRLLAPKGLLFVGHSENLTGMISDFRSAAPSIYVTNTSFIDEIRQIINRRQR
jgi:chemotaxis protein methyltransferase CheR